MATQTSTRRRAAAQRAAATRKRNQAKQSASASRFGAVGRQAQRAVLIQVGAAVTVGDKVRQAARTYSSRDVVTRELNRFERRGARAVSRQRRTLTRQRRELQRDAQQARRAVERQVNSLRSDVQDVANQMKQLV
jgi:hypothetical protein